MPFQSEIIYVHEMSATIKVGLTLITSCNLHVKLSLIEVDILVFRYRTPTHKGHHHHHLNIYMIIMKIKLTVLHLTLPWRRHVIYFKDSVKDLYVDVET